MTTGVDAEPRSSGREIRTALQTTAQPARFVPGQPDMWVFVLFEALVFTAYFTVYVISRTRSSGHFLESQAHLNLRALFLQGQKD